MSSPRFDDFREMTARYSSTGCVNGAEHEIKAGERIGWSRKDRLACCQACWIKWADENREADYLEANPGACPW